MLVEWPEAAGSVEASCAAIHQWAWRHFVYLKDEERWRGSPDINPFGEHWESDAEIEADLGDQDGVVVGDCDAFAKLCWMAARRLGLKARLVYCTLDGGGHLVCEVEGWILCNNLLRPEAQQALRPRYRFLTMSGYEPGQEWHAVVN